MIKKIGIVLVSVALAFFVFVFVQKSKWENRLQEMLIENQLTTEQMSLEVFPQPVLVLQNIKTASKSTALWQDINGQDVNVEKVRLEFDWFSLPDVTVNALNFNQFEILFSLNNTLFNKEKFYLSANKGRLLFSENQYEFNAETTKINQQIFKDFQIHLFTPAKMQENLTALLGTKNAPHQITFEFSPNQNTLAVLARKIPLEQWLNALNLPVLLTGKSDLKADFHFSQGEGKMDLQVEQGKLNGIDGLNLLSRYVPFNLNEANFSEKKMVTDFNQLTAELILVQNRLQLQKLQLFAPHFLTEASGEMDLLGQKCDFSAKIKVNQPKHSDFSLPMRFWGNCNALQYKVEIDQQFRHQLKNFVREKLK